MSEKKHYDFTSIVSTGTDLRGGYCNCIICLIPNHLDNIDLKGSNYYDLTYTRPGGLLHKEDGSGGMYIDKLWEKNKDPD